MLPMQGHPTYDDILLNRPMPLKKGGPDPEKEDRVMLMRHRVSRILFDSKFYDYPVSLKLETLKNMGFLTTMKVGFSYLGSLLHKLPEDNLENFYINRFGRKLYSMFLNITQKISGDVIPAKSMLPGVRSVLRECPSLPS